MGGLTQSQEFALQVLGTAVLVAFIAMLLRFRRFYTWLTGMPRADEDQHHQHDESGLDSNLDNKCRRTERRR